MENPYAKTEKEGSNSIELECLMCSERNTIKLSSTLKCKKCEETLLNRLYKHVIIPTTFVIATGAIGGILLDDTINFNRASVKVEYKMMKTCINEFHNRDRCACAVESMSGFVDANRARLYDRDVLKELLSERYTGCD